MGVLEFFIFALIISVSSLRLCKSFDEDDDILGLIVFKSGITDSSSHLTSWNQDDKSPCSWKFITCNPVTGRVTEIYLEGLNLSGTVGRGLEKLTSLKVLSLAGNNFSGHISPEISLLPSLERLNLSRNGFSGRIPQGLLNSGRVKFLDLSENSLSGNVLLNSSSLRVLSFAGNNLEGPIPRSLSQCTTLNHLNLSHNQFSGTPEFSSGLWRLTRIRTLDLSHNALSGSVPNGASALRNLKELSLQSNHFAGALPSDIGLCRHLKKLDLSNNMFTKSVPASFRLLSSLTYLNLADNTLTGDLPPWIGNLKDLYYLDFSGNGLTGTLPATIGGLRSLTYISLSGNSLVGNIPTSLIYSSKLSVVRLRGNLFNGSIPEGLFELGLNQIDLSRNRLTGSVPPGSSRLFETLESLDLSANALTGDIPAEIGLFTKLRYLNLSWNSFETRMPVQIGYFRNLSVLDLRNGDFHGEISGDICNSGSLGILQLDGNSLTGSIPEEIGNCSSLYLLSMSHNNLSGSIPRSISLLKRLKILKLDSNELSGEIPQELGGLQNLLAVNISYNRLQGRLPSGGIFPSLQQSSLEGNLGICSPFLKGPCKMNVPKPLVLDPYSYGDHDHGGAESSVHSKHHHRFLSVSALIAILAAVLISLGVLFISLLNISAKRRSRFIDHAIESCSSSGRSGRSGDSLPAGKLVWFDSKIAPGWSVNPESFLNKAEKLGGGVYGNVYKASLGESGHDLAIKHLAVSNTVRYFQDFDREVRVLGKARHPNLVSLKGYFWKPDFQLLVTEYAPNRSLQAWLHDGSRASEPLSWPKRFKILLGTAKGLAHLHHSFRPPIVHYNIKPSNILLDDDFNPKISDFGLTRITDKNITSNRLGYVAPEMACESLRVNEKCDVYGFGVLVLEVVTGRRPVEYTEDNVTILVEQVKNVLEDGNVLECVDCRMGEFLEEEVLPVIKLALVCTSQVPSSRPSMAEVVQILHVIKTPIRNRMEAL